MMIMKKLLIAATVAVTAFGVQAKDNAKVVAADVAADNGVIHAIDTVSMPN